MFCKISVFVAVCFLATIASALPVQDGHKEVQIVSQETVIEPDGSYRFNYETEDGVKASQTGDLKTVDKETVGISQGSYSFTADDGKTYAINYVADENGYQPTGDHLPTPPEIPAAVQKALAYLATAPPPKE